MLIISCYSSNTPLLAAGIIYYILNIKDLDKMLVDAPLTYHIVDIVKDQIIDNVNSICYNDSQIDYTSNYAIYIDNPLKAGMTEH